MCCVILHHGFLNVSMPWSCSSFPFLLSPSPSSCRQAFSLKDILRVPAEHCVGPMHMAVSRTKILQVYGLGSIRILLSRGEIPQHAGNSSNNSIRRILVCQLLVEIMAVPVIEVEQGGPWVECKVGSKRPQEEVLAWQCVIP